MQEIVHEEPVQFSCNELKEKIAHWLGPDRVPKQLNDHNGYLGLLQG